MGEPDSPGESRCYKGGPRKIVLLGDARRLARIVVELESMGFLTETTSNHGELEKECRENVLLILPRDTSISGRGGCIIWRGVPHYQLVPDLIARASKSGEWCEWEKLFHSLVLERLESLRWDPGSSLPVKPPPIVVLAEAYYDGSPSSSLDRLQTFKSEGADIVVLGYRRGDRRGFLSTVEEAVESLGIIGVDTWDTQLLFDSLDLGAWCGLSLTPDKLPLVPERLRSDKCFVLVPPLHVSRAEDRVSSLMRAWSEGGKLGFAHLVLDPILYPLVRPGALNGFLAAKLLAERVETPLLLGLHNVYELADADTTGQLLVLAGLAAEAGVSLFLVGEESVKSWGSVLEARLAADLISLALYYGTPPKDYPIRLLVAKEKGR